MKQIILLLAVILLLTGCQNYMCSDGKTVNDPTLCKKQEVKITIVEEPRPGANETNKTAEEQQLPEKKATEPGKITRFEGDYYPVELEVRNRGITLRFLGYYYVKKGDDFGKITAVKYRIKNEGAVNMTPSLKLSMVNNEGDRDFRTADVLRNEVQIDVGEEKTEESEAVISFNRLDEEKTLSLEIYDRWTKGTHLFSVSASKRFS